MKKGVFMTIRCIECGKIIKARTPGKAYKLATIHGCACERCRNQKEGNEIW